MSARAAVPILLVLLAAGMSPQIARAEVVTDGNVSFVFAPPGARVCVAIPIWSNEQQPECAPEKLDAVRAEANGRAARSGGAILFAALSTQAQWSYAIVIARSAAEPEHSSTVVDQERDLLSAQLGAPVAAGSSRSGGVQVVRFAAEVTGAATPVTLATRTVVAQQGSYRIVFTGPQGHSAELEHAADDLIGSMKGATPSRVDPNPDSERRSSWALFVTIAVAISAISAWRRHVKREAEKARSASRDRP